MTVTPSSNLVSEKQDWLYQRVYGICFFSLIPFLVFFFFTIPCSDDFFYHNYASDKTVWEFLVHHYNTWTGRYFSNFMMATNPFTLTSQMSAYPWMVIAIFLFFSAALFQMIHSVFLCAEPDSNRFSIKKNSFVTAGLVLSLFFHNMPRTSDTFYWFAGASSHLLPLSLIFCAIGIYFRDFITKGANHSAGKKFISIFILVLISFIVSGSNETLAIQWLFTLSFLLFYQKVIFNKWESVLIAPLIAALIGFGILYFAPGNTIRAAELKGGHDFIQLILKPWGLILETTVRYLSLSLILFILIFFPLFKKINLTLSEKIKSSKSLMLLGFFGLVFFALTFVPSVWTMGGLPPRRVLNNTYLIFLIYGFSLVIANSHRLIFLDRWSKRFYEQFSVKLIAIAFGVSLLFLFNNFFAWKDFVHLLDFKESLKNRAQIISASKNQDVVIPSLTYFPSTFFYEDITANRDDYRNIVFAKFFSLKSVRLDNNSTADFLPQ